MTLWPRKVIPGLHTVVLSSFNRPRRVAAAIRSVLHQTDEHWELIVADDGSNEETRRSILETCGRDTRCMLLFAESSDDRSDWPARASRRINEALSLARGDVIHYLCDDDLFAPRRIEHVRKFMSTTSSKVAFGKLVEFSDREGETLGERFVDDLVFRAAFVLNHNQFFHRASVLEQVPLGWPVSDRYEIDGLFMESLIAAGFGPLVPMDEVVAFHRHHDFNLLRTKHNFDGTREPPTEPRAPQHEAWI